MRVAPRWEASGEDGCARGPRRSSSSAHSHISDTIRPTAAAAVSQLAALGLECILLTGDNEATAQGGRRRPSE